MGCNGMKCVLWKVEGNLVKARVVAKAKAVAKVAKAGARVVAKAKAVAKVVAKAGAKAVAKERRAKLMAKAVTRERRANSQKEPRETRV